MFTRYASLFSREREVDVCAVMSQHQQNEIFLDFVANICIIIIIYIKTNIIYINAKIVYIKDKIFYIKEKIILCAASRDIVRAIWISCRFHFLFKIEGNAFESLNEISQHPIIVTIATLILGQQESFLRKPWPQYSLHNMPKTQFTCHDKILGGYYADPEAQCQMFHVCVKVAGVGAILKVNFNSIFISIYYVLLLERGGSKKEFDDFLKGSHSSNFFTNRNGGREEDYLEHSKKFKPNDFIDFNKKSESTTTIGKNRVSTIKIKRPLQTSSVDFNLITTPTSPKIIKKVTVQTPFKSDPFGYSSTTPSTTTTSSTTIKPFQNNFSKINFNINDYETQAKIQPTTYNPNRLKSVTTKYNELKRDKAVDLEGYQNKGFNKPIIGNSRKAQKFEETLQKSEDFNEFKEFSRAKPQQPQPFKSQKPTKTFDDSLKIEPQYQRSRSQNVRVNNQQPTPFSAPQRQTTSNKKALDLIKPTVNNDNKPRGFANRGKINFKASTQYDYYENYRTTTNDQKKFSTLVSKYAPTTFKPTKKSNDRNFYQTPQTVKSQNPTQKSSNSFIKTYNEPTTANPYYNPDEDDGQYHPELYELDYSRNRFNLQRSTSTTGISTTANTTPRPFNTYQNPAIHLKSQQQTSFLKEQGALSDFSDEDDLFKTAQSLNFGAASINKLRADIIKAEKTSQQYNSQYNPHNSFFASPNSTTTLAPKYTSTTLNYYTQPSTTQTSLKSNAYGENLVFTSTTTVRPSTLAYSTTTTTTKTSSLPSGFYKKTEKSGNTKSSKLKSNKKTSKRPPHADEDTSYDYAYYDTDTLSESPQEYQDYEIAEFARTRKN
uniref:Uncharacterized protein n=1 Tax=Glossina brevipalpis TaxID=37001 RepID=A0A1A9WRR4_9MUSC